jgi:ABC-type Fe3+-hydroxamate transport system substrate-binding protein
MLLRSLLTFLLATLLAATSSAQSPASNDDSTTESLRLVSLVPSLTEMLFALGMSDQVVGVSDYCRYPQEATEKTKVGGYHNPNFEVIVSLKPDLVLATVSARSLEDRLRQAGIEVFEVSIENIEDIRSTLQTLGQRFGVDSRATSIISGIDQDLNKLKTKTRDQTPPTVLYVIGHAPTALQEIYAVGPNTFIDEMISVAGGSNIMADSPAIYPMVSREVMIQRVPDIVIDATGGLDEKKMEAAWYEFLGVKGREQTQIIFVNDHHLVIPGPSVGKNARKLYGYLFEG